MLHLVRSIASLFLALLALPCAFAQDHGDGDPFAGKRFESKAEVEQFASSQKFSLLGAFGDSWPANVERVERGAGSIEVETDQGKQSYPDFAGYELKALTLRSDDGKRVVMVLRSDDKQ